MDSQISKRTRSYREASPSPPRPLCNKSTTQVANSSQLLNGRQEKKYLEAFSPEKKRSQHIPSSSVPVHVEPRSPVQMANTSDQVRPRFIKLPISCFIRRVFSLANTPAAWRQTRDAGGYSRRSRRC